ncbi:MAG: hypothetical protein R2790_10585 [Flavobacterium haoranii]
MKNIIFITLFFINLNLFSQEKTIVKNIEGFYIQGWEYSNFMQIDIENCQYSNHWTEFTPNLKYNGKPFDFGQIENLEEFYMKVNATLISGETYGHLGSWKSKIIINEIIEISVARKINDFKDDCKLLMRVD